MGIRWSIRTCKRKKSEERNTTRELNDEKTEVQIENFRIDMS